MARCSIHPGRDAPGTAFGKPYCQKCLDGQTAAVSDVTQNNVHVEPKACFINHKGGDHWEALSGTGCAHWLAHQLNIGHGAAWNKCLAGHTIRVPDVIYGRKEVSQADVRVNDIWANPHLTHTGLVSAVGSDKGATRAISITHDSSAQGGVRTNDFQQYFHGEGKFYR